MAATASGISATAMEGRSVTALAAHFTLLEDAVSTQLGPLAGRIVRKLSDRGPMTLKDIANALSEEPFQARTTILEAARAVGSNLNLGGDAGGSKKANSKSMNNNTNGDNSSSGSIEPSVLVDASIKEVMTRLILHRIVSACEYETSYELRLGYGLLLHVLHPLIAQGARRRYGEAGEALALVIRQLAAVPVGAAARLAAERCPSIGADAVRAAAAAMAADGWLENVFPAEAAADASESGGGGGRKRSRADAASASASPSSDFTCRLCAPVILRELLQDALEQWVSERFPDGGGLPVAVASLLLSSMHTGQRGEVDPTCNGGGGDVFRPRSADTAADGALGALLESGEGGAAAAVQNPYGYPLIGLGPFSRPVTPSEVCLALQAAAAAGGDVSFGGSSSRLALYSAFATASHEAVSATLRRLAAVTSTNGGPAGPIVTATASGDRFWMQLSAVLSALQMDCCERTVFSRHGVLGVRLMKLLLQQRMLEDRTLAEEAVATQPRTRQTLSAMMHDGYCFQQEVPRGAITGDRQPKSSVFLWEVSMRRSLVPAVRVQLAQALLHATTKLREVVHRGNANSNTHTINVNRNSIASGGVGVGVVAASSPSGGSLEKMRAAQDLARWAVRDQRNAVGLESCAMALMRMLLITDYYQ